VEGALVGQGAQRGLLRLSSDLVIIDGAVLPSGVGIVSSSVSDGMEADFIAAHTADEGRIGILRI
jgi:hypothetical protein